MNTVRHVRRFLPVLALLAFVPALLTGCSSPGGKKPIPRPVIGQRNADDIAQMLATMLSADNGGWYSTVKVLSESLAVTPVPATFFGAGASPFGRFAAPSRATSLLTAYSYDKAGVHWNANVAYFHGDNSAFAVRDTATDYLEAYFGCDQGVFTDANGLTGTYGYHNSSTPADTNSWGLTVFGLSSSSDTLEFSGFADDTCFAVVHSTLNTDGPRLWFMGGATQNFMDFALKIPKSTLTTSPYPVTDYSEINWVIEADGLNGTSPSRTDIAQSILTEAKMTFTGVPAGYGLLVIQDVIGDAAYSYRFRVNLNSGAIERVP